MRIFVAVEIGDEARRVAAVTAAALRADIGASFKARWVPPENMHLTVRFIGQVDDGLAPALIDALTPGLDIAPFDLELDGCGAFPQNGPPRVLWMGLTQGLPSLTLMHQAFNRRLRPFGFEPEGRPYNAHLTLARVKDAPRGSAAAAREALRRVTPSPVTCHVTRATIFQSYMSPKGSRYEPMAFAELKGKS
jgi:2'-5' RNA ligase